jgi:hypothetical protein
MKLRSYGLLACVLSGVFACGGEEGSDGDGSLEVELGIPDVTRRNFEPLAMGGTIYYAKGAQVQEFIMFAVRVHANVPSAQVNVVVTRTDTGDRIAHAEPRPEPLTCTPDGWCTLTPILLPASELGDLTEINDKTLDVSADVVTDVGERGHAEAHGVLMPENDLTRPASVSHP